MKILVKFIHTSIADGKDPKLELQNYLLQYRSAPHSTTGVSPAEALFGRKLKTKLPQLPVHSDTPAQKKMRDCHDARKLRQKKYFDKGHRAAEKTVQPGDTVLVRQKKTTTKPPFDPHAYEVVKVKGKRVTSKREDKILVRDKNHVKVVPPRPSTLCPSFAKKKNKTLKTTPQHDFDDDDDISHIINNTNRVVHLPPDSASGSDSSNSPVAPLRDESLFQIDEEERSRMQQLFDNLLTPTPTQQPCSPTSPPSMSPRQAAAAAVAAAAAIPSCKARLRSAQRNLRWDPEMNSQSAVLEL